ncbi:MAG: two-component sensor histidine kinase [Comamonadaceae bacterium]|nr:MAG: two-component sensor histidine kinase [Comamonadaceae bacterium]
MIDRQSLTFSLMAWTLGALLIVWGAFVFLGYRTGIHEADELTDGHLASVASLELSEDPGVPEDRSKISQLPGLTELKSHDYQRSMSVVIWDKDGNELSRTGEAPPVPFTTGEGFETLPLGSPPVAWRTFSRWDGPSHNRKVTVLLNQVERDDLAEDIAGQMTEPGFWLLPVVALALGFAIRRGLKPLYALSQDVDRLDLHRPAPLQGNHFQSEFKAVVNSINTLSGRYQLAVSMERELANELAHELRTPLASLTLQARALREAASPEEHEQRLAQLENDALRAGQVLSNLLALARASRTEMLETTQVLDLDALARTEIAQFGQVAMETGHDLGLSSPGAFMLPGHPVLLSMAIRNLIENALSHTPPGSQVEVQLDPRARWLQVSDSGVSKKPAAPAPKSGSDPATRSLGLGSGHRVIEKVAAIHGATFALVPAPEGFGTCYRMTFAAAAEGGAVDRDSRALG